ncbi:MAG: DUF3127 domain-containing protein [Flavobacterium sp.]|nr:DUF3127 domain-containing protein [Flavobacterium sp.]MBP6424182.1 DUF3127 domain-containing protein [Flavobacterium sp.]
MNFIGEVIEIEDLKVSTSGFKSRKIVVKNNEQYGQTIPIEFVQDKTDLIDKLSIGQNVNVSINLKGNIYNEKRFVTVQGWKIE